MTIWPYPIYGMVLTPRCDRKFVGVQLWGGYRLIKFIIEPFLNPATFLSQACSDTWQMALRHGKVSCSSRYYPTVTWLQQMNTLVIIWFTFVTIFNLLFCCFLLIIVAQDFALLEWELWWYFGFWKPPVNWYYVYPQLQWSGILNKVSWLPYFSEYFPSCSFCMT